jgi:GTP-binding protein
MPQTKFVLKNALALGLPVVVCVNKVDRPEARCEEVVDEILELFMELDATDEQLDSPFVFASAKLGKASLNPDDVLEKEDMKPLFDTIIEHIPGPEGDAEAPLQMLVTTIDFNEYVGKIGIGKIENGSVKVNDEVAIVNIHDPEKLEKIRVTKLYEYEGLERVEVKESSMGSIVAVSGMPEIHIGDTIAAVENPVPIEVSKISEPTLSMMFSVNDSPFAGQEGKFVTSRHLRERLMRELNTDVSLKVEDTERPEAFKVSGRGELHLSILIETMRREGYEFQVARPQVLYKEENGKKVEPMELATIDVPEEYVGSVIEKLGQRKGEMVNMMPSKGGYTRLEFNIPARGLIGYRNEFLTDTRGNGILNTIFNGYEPYKGDIESRQQGSLIAFETGEAVSYGLFNAQDRGDLFIGAGTKVYSGMVVGRNSRTGDMEVNVCKKKQLTNTRASGSDDALKLTPHIVMSLEQCIDFISDDELVEVTPENLRLRKKLLDPIARRKANRY